MFPCLTLLRHYLSDQRCQDSKIATPEIICVSSGLAGSLLHSFITGQTAGFCCPACILFLGLCFLSTSPISHLDINLRSCSTLTHHKVNRMKKRRIITVKNFLQKGSDKQQSSYKGKGRYDIMPRSKAVNTKPHS